jgi:DNA (cytosine-5)-methyltransferase 1
VPRKLTAIDAFCGAGGLSLGAKLAGFGLKLAIERDKYAAATYQKNFPGVELINDDIDTVAPRRISKSVGSSLDLLVAGPPCQGYSIANLRTRNRHNPLNGLHRSVVELARQLNPRAVLIENVGGILTYRKGKELRSIEESLSKLGYSTEVITLNAIDFGVPQSRRRVFLVGFRGEPRPLGPMLKELRRPCPSVAESISDLPKLNPGNSIDCLPYSPLERPSKYQREMRSRGEQMVTGCLTSRHSALTIRRFKAVRPGRNWQDIPARLFKTYANPQNCHRWLFRRLLPHSPSVTITNFRKGMLIHPYSDRTLSIREAARLQSFPDSFTFLGPLQARQQQVANAVPPRLAYAVIQAIRTELLRLG